MDSDDDVTCPVVERLATLLTVCADPTPEQTTAESIS